MSEIKHTPGPWVMLLSDNATPYILHGGWNAEFKELADPEHLVCIMPAEIANSYNSFANARLIAAAPDLLEAAKAAEKAIDILWVSHHANRSDDALKTLRAAIAKARGEA